MLNEVREMESTIHTACDEHVSCNSRGFDWWEGREMADQYF